MHYTKKCQFTFTDVLVRISFWKTATATVGERQLAKNAYCPEYLTQERVLRQTAKVKRAAEELINSVRVQTHEHCHM